MAYDNTNRWTLNKNDRKEKDTHCDYKGSINVDGVDYWLDGWIKDGANGKFISGSLKRKEARGPLSANMTGAAGSQFTGQSYQGSVGDFGPQEDSPF